MSTPSGDPDSGTPEIGVIRAPALQEHVFARRGGPAWYSQDGKQPVAAQVGSTPRLDQGLLLTSEVATFETHRSPPALDVYLELQREAKLARTWGDAYGYLMVATGRADVMIDAAMSLWDAAAIQPIIEGAGGKFTDWQGVATVHSGEAVAANPQLMEQILATTRGR
jgi:fructose-1,6-bisphosphatase/inositol monophosphatase family enzyme